jgi:hypothetical protein
MRNEGNQVYIFTREWNSLSVWHKNVFITWREHWDFWRTESRYNYTLHTRYIHSPHILPFPSYIILLWRLSTVINVQFKRKNQLPSAKKKRKTEKMKKRWILGDASCNFQPSEPNITNRIVNAFPEKVKYFYMTWQGMYQIEGFLCWINPQ